MCARLGARRGRWPVGRPSAGNTARDTPAPGPVDKMSNVPVKVFMPNLIMLMKPGWCWWGWPQILAVMVTTPRNFRSSLLLIKGPTFIFTTFSLHTSYPCTKQSMQTCSTLIWSHFPNFLSDLSSICLQSTVWKCIQRVPPYPRANNTLSGLSDSKFDWRAWDCTQDYVWLWRLTDGTRSPYHLGLRSSSASKRSIRRFVTTEKAPTMAFSWLKAAILPLSHLRHY